MLSLIELSGSPFQIGRSLGVFGAQAVHSYLTKSADWQNVMAWRGSPTAQSMKDLVQQHFPDIHQELLGLADGLDLPAEDVFLWNCRGDLWAMAPDGCTTVQLPQPGGARITHNEDGDPGFAGYCGLGLFQPDSGPDFASFVYPASIPGHTFAVTEHGLAITVNNLRSRRMGKGLPRMVLTRELLNQATMKQAVNVLQTMPKAGGFHLSMAQSGQDELLSVEFNAMGVSAMPIEHASVHANHAVHPDMCDFPQLITRSSQYRQQHGNAMMRGAETDPLLVLADQSNEDFPIYRSSTDDSDQENTLATADIHVGAKEVSWYVHERPDQSARFSLVNAQMA